METAKDPESNNQGVDTEAPESTRGSKMGNNSKQVEVIYIKCDESEHKNFLKSEVKSVNGGCGAIVDEEVKCGILEGVEEPMDLTFSQCQIKHGNQAGPSTSTHNSLGTNNVLSDDQALDEAKSNASCAIAKLVQNDHLLLNTSMPKKRGRKRKEVEVHISRSTNISPTFDNPEYVQTMDNRQAEVLMAAKSLFSKRTRTLYHWMYPNTPKAQLKSAVSMSWETLGIQEKEFYISQVLGRFGFPQSSLMVNPQLGGMRGVPMLPPLDLSTPNHLNLETHHAVSTILENQANGHGDATTSWPQYTYPPPHTKRVNRKRGRLGRPPGSKSQRHMKEQNIAIKPVTVESISDDFQDDPELRKEFEQFKWALHMTDK